MHDTTSNPVSFFTVFAICFPAFTGMTAGVGLSGDLKDPKKSIPLGTLSATIIGMIVYVFIAYKLAISVPADVLADPNNSLIMSTIALWGPIIPIGLAAATFSSALGSIMVAPRTLQALANDGVFVTPKVNEWMKKGTVKSNEPKNATLITCLIALVFVCMGDVNAVAEIISMFFMVTYGALCAISFLQHFAADPSYIPSFKSRWYISLVGAVMCVWLMFQTNTPYAVASLVFMVVLFLLISHYSKEKQGMTKIFQGVIFQFLRQIQVFVQKVEKDDPEDNWRPTILSISKDTFIRPTSFDFMRYMSHRYGFGSYIHHVEGYFSKESNNQAENELKRLIQMSEASGSNVFLDTLISPSYTSSLVQALQMPSISGKDVNMFLFEYYKEKPDRLAQIVENLPLVRAANYDVCILASSQKGFGYKKEIHIWITPQDFENASLMILLGYVIMGHSEWKRAEIKIFAIFPEEEIKQQKERLLNLISEGRLPISAHNIEVLLRSKDEKTKDLIQKHSKDSDLTIVGFRTEIIESKGEAFFTEFESINNMLFVNSVKEKEIK